MVGEVDLSERVEALDVGHHVDRVAVRHPASDLVVDGGHHAGLVLVVGGVGLVGARLVGGPHAAHGVVDRGEDLHGGRPGVVARELLIDLHDPAQLAGEVVGVLVGQVEVDHVPAADAHVLIDADVEDLAGRDVARHEVAVRGVLLLEEVQALVLRDVRGGAVIARLAGHPDAPALAAGGLAHQAALVGAGDRGGVDLDHLAVAVPGARLIAAGGGAARADDRVGGLAEDEPVAAGRHDDRVAPEGPDLHRAHVLGDDADAALLVALALHHGPEELPELVLVDLALRLVPTRLLVEGVEELLPGCRAGEVGALEERAAEQAEIATPLVRPVERDAHPVEQVDDAGGPVRHLEDGVLVGEEVAPVQRLVEVLVLRVPLLPRDLVARVDPALSAHAVRPLHGDHAEQVHGHARLGDPDRGGEAREPAAHHDDPSFVLCDHLSCSQLLGVFRSDRLGVDFVQSGRTVSC